MEGSEGSPPQSLCMIRAAELFPKPAMEKEDADLAVPFQELPGESVKYLGRTDDGVLALSNYRLFLLKDSTSSETSVPLGLIEAVQLRDLFHLIINCKDCSTVKCSFETAEQCGEWQRRIQLSVGVPETLESLFAFPFYSWTCDTHSHATNGGAALNGGSLPNGTWTGGGGVGGGGIDPCVYMPSAMSILQADTSDRLQRASRYEDDFMREVERLGFDLNGSWRVSHANEDFKLCPSYPQKILVPFCIPDDMLHGVANFRGSRRLPAVVWRHQRSGAVIARCSQPEVGWLGWRNSKDEQLLKALADACAFDRGELQRRLGSHLGHQAGGSAAAAAATMNPNTQTTSVPNSSSSNNNNPSSDSAPSSPDSSHEEVALDEIRKVLIVDARSYTSAVTNRARGGGCECIEYYPSAEIEFMNLGNIHVIRKSFHALRQLCASPSDIPNWLGLLEKTMWLQHLSGLLAASMTVCHAIEKKGRPVLVHCSDGWDRTPQIVATAQLCLDPYYRTVEGFRILVEREWLSYGHKFADRCGHGPGSDELNERCPVFLQWLDLVHQIHKQFPCSFEFSMGYLIKLAQHSLSCLFGTFLCNTLKERIENSVFERTFSVWPFLSGPMYRNPLYIANKERVLWPAHNVRDLSLWTEVYLGSLGNKSGIEFNSCNAEGVNGSISPMAKTRSYGDLISAGIYQNGMSRRSSDPNMSVEPNLLVSSESENNSIADMPPNGGSDSPDVIATFIHDTTRKLQDLTTELNNQHVEEDFGGNKCFDTPATRLEQLGKGPEGSDDKAATTTATRDSVDTRAQSLGFDSTLPGDTERKDNGYGQQQDGECTVDSGAGITAPKTYSLNIDLMHSVDLGPSKESAMNSSNGFQETATTGTASTTTNGCYNEIQVENMWHGSVNTSTDTLVPIERSQQQPSDYLSRDEGPQGEPAQGQTANCDTSDGANLTRSMDNGLGNSSDDRTPSKSANSCKILPKIHTSMTKSISSAGTALKPDLQSDMPAAAEDASRNLNGDSNVPSQMDESIMILPVHQKLEISVSGKCETVSGTESENSGTFAAAQSANPPRVLPPFYLMAGQRRRRTSSSNSRYDAFMAKQPQQFHNGGSVSRVSLPSARSLPMTPPGLPERPQIAISCPDGLAHALSEQNIRLQQIVHEHKLREDVLLRELHDMRMALLKRTCPNCNNAANSNDEQCSGLDNVENSSICSWEAVEDRSGASSCTSSTIQPNNATSVLWVPDHAVSRCTSCQTEFWLGRRKHHCRSCGQIFCADCSEFWAALPDIKLFSPVRLCGPCYHAVTTRMQASAIQPAATAGSISASTNAALSQYHNHQQQHHNHHQHTHSALMMPPTMAMAKSVGSSPCVATASTAATSKA